ncbi:MAG: exodeoxyribonuclease VII large subunit [Bacilli bacterium]|nr:exodeoxyribonuclease VII large subunit [Bacilli bacterium]MDD4282969.1 exodeoxyribonuclease VII large subunit [Bacilli bacterium]MDD4719169.1 exodeoxyribonuclease VII large subunit [Bacilli bacterium]
MNDNKYLTVEALTKYLKYKFDSDINLKTVFLKGEISNFKAHTTGHFYFSIKDEYSKINAIMFSAHNKKMVFTPTEGMKVLVRGRISIYETTGNYQIYVEEMLEDGLGNLHIAFEQLKEKLSKEGLFDPIHKKVIPKIPSRVGVITAATGAAVKDIISTIERRFPICEILLFPSLVQGDNAAPDIVKKITQANDYDLDVLIIGRGGGSIEDLWPFNEEIVARAIFNSRIPIISAVGHEIDYTISDFVSDLRAPTPTAAAELAVPNIIDLAHNLNQITIRFNEFIYKQINFKKLYLDSIKNSFVIKNPMIMYENKKQNLDNIIEKVNQLLLYKLDINKAIFTNLKNNNILLNPINLYKPKQLELTNIISKLELLNPLSILKRGYTLTYIDDKIVKNVSDVSIDSNLKIKFYNGVVDTKVIGKEELNEK